MILDITGTTGIIMMVCSVIAVLGAAGRLLKEQGEDIAVLKKMTDDHKDKIEQHDSRISRMQDEWVSEIRKIREAFARMEGRVGKIFDFEENNNNGHK